METPFPAYRGDEPYVFVCYSHQDSAAVFPELERFRESGVNVYYDEGISPGSEWTQELADAIDGASRFLYFVSPSSVASRYCRNEVSYALERGKPVVSVHLEPTELPGGLMLSIGTAQAILKYNLSPESYERKLMEVLPVSGVPGDDPRSWAQVETMPKRGQQTIAGVSPAMESPDRPARRRATTLLSAAVLAILLLGGGVAWWLDVRAPEPASGPQSRDALLRSLAVGVQQPEDLTGSMALAAWPRMIAQDVVAALKQGTPMVVVPEYGGTGSAASEEPDYRLRSVLSADPAPSLHLELIGTRSGKAIWVDDIALDMTPGTEPGLPRADYVAHVLALVIMVDRRQMDNTEHLFSNDDARALWIRGFAGAQIRDAAGRGLSRRDAARLVERAAELDPESPLPPAYLAYVYSVADWLEDDRARSAKANAAGRRALALGPEVAWPHFAMGYVKGTVDRDFDAAKRHFELARKFGWASHDIEYHLGQLERGRGNLRAAVSHYEESLALGGVLTAPWALADLASTLIHLGRYDDAEEYLDRWDRSVGAEKAKIYAPWARVAIDAKRGNLEAARARLQDILQGLPAPPPAELLAMQLAMLGEHDEARALLTKLESSYARGDRINCVFAFLAAYRLDQLDLAFTWLDRAVSRRQSHHLLYGVEVEPIRNDPRFQQALARIEAYTIHDT